MSKASESRNRTLGPIQLPKPQAAQTNACATFKNVCLWVQGAQEKQKEQSQLKSLKSHSSGCSGILCASFREDDMGRNSSSEIPTKRPTNCGGPSRAAMVGQTTGKSPRDFEQKRVVSTSKSRAVDSCCIFDVPIHGDTCFMLFDIRLPIGH